MPVLSNPKHEKFAQELAKGKTATEAYVLAGYSANDSNAARMNGNERVQARLKEIADRVAEKVVERIAIDKEWVLTRLVENVERAMQAKAVMDSDGAPTGEFKYEGSVANRALELVGKELGMFVDRSENVNLNQDITDKPLSDEEWAERHVTEH